MAAAVVVVPIQMALKALYQILIHLNQQVAVSVAKELQHLLVQERALVVQAAQVEVKAVTYKPLRVVVQEILQAQVHHKVQTVELIVGSTRAPAAVAVVEPLAALVLVPPPTKMAATAAVEQHQVLLVQV